MQYFVREIEGQYMSWCDLFPEGACHSDRFDTPEEALTSLINQEIPDFKKFLQEKATLWTRQELFVLYTKVHESLEGRYDLDGIDLYDIEAALVSYSNLLHDLKDR